MFKCQHCGRNTSIGEPCNKKTKETRQKVYSYYLFKDKLHNKKIINNALSDEEIEQYKIDGWDLIDEKIIIGSEIAKELSVCGVCFSLLNKRMTGNV